LPVSVELIEASTMDDSRTWIAEYEQIKRQITQQRASGNSYSSTQASATMAKINQLEAALNTVKSSGTM
jgi:hypothetical protein